MKSVVFLIFVCIFTMLSVLGTLMISNQLCLVKKVRLPKKRTFLLIKKKFQTVTIKPIIEEIFVRYYIFDILGKCIDDSVIFVLLFLAISSFVFSVIHLPKTRNLFFEKLLIGGLYYSLIYWLTFNIIIVMLVHILHNITILILCGDK